MHPEVLSDVLVAAQANAPWAFEVLYRHFAPAVMSYLRLQGVEDPESLTNEVFLGAFQGLGRFSGDVEAFRSWLFTIAHRRVTDDRRRRRRRVDTVALDRRDERMVGGDVEEEALAGLGSARVLHVLGGLPKDQRNVLLLRVVADLTVEQVAGLLGKQVGAVKALQRRALLNLRKSAAREGVPL